MGLILCKVVINGNLGKSLHPQAGREYESMAKMVRDMRNHPERFTDGCTYTLIDTRPEYTIRAKQQFDVFEAKAE